MGRFSGSRANCVSRPALFVFGQRLNLGHPVIRRAPETAICRQPRQLLRFILDQCFFPASMLHSVKVSNHCVLCCVCQRNCSPGQSSTLGALVIG